MPKTRASRTPLSPERIVAAAVALADEVGDIDAFSMRGLAQELGVVPMALYKHVANKDKLLDGMIDLVFEEIEVPTDADWRTAMRHRGLSVRAALRRHPWAIGLMETRHAGAANLRVHDQVMGCLRRGGFDFATAIHAYSVQDAYLYGFALQEKTLGFETADSAGEAARRRAAEVEGWTDHPYLAEIAEKLPEVGYDPDVEFLWGLDLILDGLERRRGQATSDPSTATASSS